MTYIDQAELQVEKRPDSALDLPAVGRRRGPQYTLMHYGWRLVVDTASS
jgi:hypothetical protein